MSKLSEERLEHISDLELQLCRIKASRDALQAELAEVYKDFQSWRNGCLNDHVTHGELEDLETELAQTRALLAVRTGALASIYNAKVVWPHASAYNMMDEREEGEARLSVLSKFIGDQNVKAFNALASTGTEELAAIRDVIAFTHPNRCNLVKCKDGCHKPREAALAALKEYFGGGG